jgi:hypothetical protein
MSASACIVIVYASSHRYISSTVPFDSTQGDGLDVSSSQVPSSFGPSTWPKRVQGPSRLVLRGS